MGQINMFLFMMLVLFTVYIQNGDSCCKFRAYSPECKLDRGGPGCSMRFGCFGCGPCNMFCCNCDEGCCPGRKRRALPEFLNINRTTIANGIEYFHAVDLNEDYVISPDEFFHYIKHNNIIGGKYDKASLSQYFNQTDQNADGLIQPVEFDRKLVNVKLSY